MATSNDFIPAKDADLLSWGDNYVTLITAAPTSYGLVAGDATAATTAYNAFAAALATATTPGTRTTPAVAAKDTARATFVALVRLQVQQIQATPTVTDEQKADLAITIRVETRTPIPAPTTRPIQTVVRSNGPVLDFRLNDEETPDTRAFPNGVTLCQIFMSTAETPPASTASMTLLATVGRAVNVLNVGGVAVADTMYFRSRWINRRGQPGPDSELISQIRTE